MIMMKGNTDGEIGVMYFFWELLIPTKLLVLNSSTNVQVLVSKYKPIGYPFFLLNMLGNESAA